MAEIIASAVVALARLAVIAFAIRHGRDVLIHWLDRMPTRAPEESILDASRAAGVDLHQLAEHQR